MNDFLKKFLEDQEKKENIFCPWCGKKQENDDGQYPVNYWGTDGSDLEEFGCDSCQKTFYVEEIVTRKYREYKRRG
jgi:hypothetical protein